METESVIPPDLSGNPLPDRLSCPLFIYVVHFEFEFTGNQTVTEGVIIVRVPRNTHLFVLKEIW